MPLRCRIGKAGFCLRTRANQPQGRGHATAATVVSPMKTFYTLHVHRKDGSWHRHLMRGELPKVGDTIPVLLPGENIMAKVDAVAEERGEAAIKVMADQVRPPVP